MKFWKSLSILIEDTLPEWRDKFLSYKDLKKQLKLIYPKDGDKPPSKRLKSGNVAADGSDCNGREIGGGGGDVTKEVIDFVRLLEDEMEKLNSFIVEKEEDSVIKWKELQDRAAEAKDSKDELMSVGREIVDLHGEMILLENYSALNYTGLVKILKKYDKRSGALLRVPFIRTVMQQPFFTTHVLNMLVKECEATLDNLFSRSEPPPPPSVAPREPSGGETMTTADEERPSSSFRVPNELNEIENMESMYMKQTLSALRVLKEIRSGSSTVNMFSLPPLQSHAPLEEDWKKLSVLEQAAK